MPLLKRKIIAGIGLSALVAFMALGLFCAAGAAEQKDLHYRTIGTGDYQSFIRNWDDGEHPVLYALIQSPAQWNMVFHPAPVMGKNRPFGPEKKEFEHECLLVTARVTSPSDKATAFRVDKVEWKNKELTLRYTFEKPAAAGSYSVKDYLGVWVPKSVLKKVVFIENGKRIGVLNVSRGQWRVPRVQRSN